MNKNAMIALVGALAFSTATVNAYASDKAAKADKADKGAKKGGATGTCGRKACVAPNECGAPKKSGEHQ